MCFEFNSRHVFAIFSITRFHFKHQPHLSHFWNYRQTSLRAKIMDTSESLFSNMSLDVGENERIESTLHLEESVSSAFTRLAHLETIGRQVSAFQFDDGLKVIKHALAARFLLRDAIRRNVAVDIRIICDTSLKLCHRYETLGLIVSVAISTARILDSISMTFDASSHCHLEISKHHLQTIRNQIRDCKYLACCAVLRRNTGLVNRAKTMADEISFSWCKALAFSRFSSLNTPPLPNNNLVLSAPNKEFLSLTFKKIPYISTPEQRKIPFSETPDIRSATKSLEMYKISEVRASALSNVNVGATLGHKNNQFHELQTDLTTSQQDCTKSVCARNSSLSICSFTGFSFPPSKSMSAGKAEGTAKRLDESGNSSRWGWKFYAIRLVFLFCLGLLSRFWLASASRAETGYTCEQYRCTKNRLERTSFGNIYIVMYKNNGLASDRHGCAQKVSCEFEGNIDGEAPEGIEINAAPAESWVALGSQFHHVLNIATRTIVFLVVQVVRVLVPVANLVLNTV